MNDFIKEIELAQTIAIVGHIRPDGDCVGSSLGLLNYLKDNYADKKVTVYLEEFKEVFHFLRFAKEVQHTYDDAAYDLFISVDCGDVDRFGEASQYYYSAKKTICIDHHISNSGFADLRYIFPEASSTCEVLFGLLDEKLISKDTATALYLGIAHDTGVFKFSNVSNKTMKIVGCLVAKGVDTSYVIDETFYQKTYLQNQILGRALLESILILDGRCIFSYISRKNLDFYGAKSDDLDGIIDQLRITKGVEVAIFIYEIKNGEYKVSMRSNNQINVSSIAKIFNGGGHIKAAGCTMNGSIHDVVNNLSFHIEKQLKVE